MIAVASAATLVVASPASAAVQLNSDGSITVTGTSGGSATVNLNGNASGTNVAGLTSALTLNFVSAVNGVYTFSYTMQNTSTSPVTSSRLNAFAFNTSPDITAGGATILSGSLFDQIRLDSNFPNGIGNVELCFTTHNCTGGGSEGLGNGQSSSGSFSLTFGTTNLTTLTLNNIVVRYQAVDAPGFNSVSATGRVITTAVPEPGTWAMMLLGFGAIGFSMRRRRASSKLLQLA